MTKSDLIKVIYASVYHLKDEHQHPKYVEAIEDVLQLINETTNKYEGFTTEKIGGKENGKC